MKGLRARLIFLALISFSLAMLAASAYAAPPVGQYNATFYFDDAGLSLGATQSVCFEGGPSKGTWYSTTWPWTGNWWRKGASSDVIMLEGNAQSGYENVAGKIEIINTSLMAGSVIDWFDDGAFIGWVQVKLMKQKTICDPLPLLNMSNKRSGTE